MAHRFPLFRLGTLLARQLSAPIATRIKRFAVHNPRFRRGVRRAGRAFYSCELRFRMWTLALRQPRTLPPISDQAALNAGADILGEAVIFTLGGLIIVLEVNRQANKLEDKVLEEESRWLALQVALQELRRELELQQQDIDRLHATLRRLAHRRSPPTPKLPSSETAEHSPSEHSPPERSPPEHSPPVTPRLPPELHPKSDSECIPPEKSE
uniref:OPA3-like protein n=1 Tax=Heliothis virescens TaxID=7102 RepID=A0A2A4JH52_HELVI